MSFAGLILLGLILLMLPQAATGQRLSFIDALFMATSATCVTGLTVIDTGTKLSLFGQITVLLLIQLGGIGILTFSTFFIFLVIGKFSISDREIMQETFTQLPSRNLPELLKSIFLFTFIIEAIGASLLTFRFMDHLAFKQACYSGIFHAISAFCNAGFSLFQNSFIGYQSDPIINLTIIFLIVAGGLGFIVLFELRNYFFKRKNRPQNIFSFHSKTVLVTSGILIISGLTIFLIFEYSNVLSSQSWKNRFFISFFQSVTCRTAGFNSVDIWSLTNSTLFFMIILMFIGASPGSSGGGIKTTTASIVAAMFRARFNNQDDVNLANRKISEVVVSRAISVTFFSMFIIVSATMLLMTTELGGLSHLKSRGLFLECLYEAVSAFGTVGLSTGITASLSTAGKVIIIATMFIGRLGPLTIAIAMGKKKKNRFKYAEEKILIG